MAFGYVTPCSVYLGAAGGLLSPNFYVPATNTNTFGDVEGIQVVASLGSFSDAPASLKFWTPTPLPSGQLKLRSIFQANATSGVVKYTVKDGNCAPSSNPGAATLTTEMQQLLTWTTADVLVENKLNLAATPSAGDLMIVGITFNATGWTLASILSGQHVLVWE